MRQRCASLVSALVVLALIIGASSSAHADKVDRLIEQLGTNGSYKVRLSAAIGLANIGDPRAIPACIDALSDSDKAVRGAAATSLSKLVDGGTSATLRKRAVRALTRSAKRDKDSFVRQQAKQALASLANAGSSGGIYVHIGPMAAKTKKAAAMKALMRRTAEKTFASKATSMSTDWPGGSAPSAKALRAQNVQAFHVDGTLVKLSTEAKGKSTLISCKVSMLIATYPKKSLFGFLDGGARVQTGSSPREIGYAEDDCVTAVVEDLIAKKIIPTIRMRTSSQTTTQTRSPRQRQQRSRRGQRTQGKRSRRGTRP